MVRLLEDAEIDDWFAESKQKLEEQMMESLMKGASPEKEREKFNKAYWKLFAQYNKHYETAVAYKKRQEKLHKPIKKFTLWRKNKTDALTSWFRLKKAEASKAWFEYRYRRMFHIKQRKI